MIALSIAILEYNSHSYLKWIEVVFQFKLVIKFIFE